MNNSLMDLFQNFLLDPGQLPEFYADEPVWFFFAPGRNQEPENHFGCESLYVPTYEIGSEADTVEEAIENVTNDLYDDAWRLLLAAGEAGPMVFGTTKKSVVADMSRRLDGEALTVYDRGNDIVGVRFSMRQSVVCVVREEPGLIHVPPLRPVCWMVCGLAVLDHRAVIRGKVIKP